MGVSTDIGANGARLDVEAGDSITAASDYGVAQTVLGVQAGDTITFGEVCGPPHTATEITATWEAVPEATSYAACTACDCEPTPLGGALSTTPYLCDDVDPDIEDITVYAFGSDGPLAFSWRADAVVDADGRVAAGPWQPISSLTINVEALPSSADAYLVTTEIGGSARVAARKDWVVAPLTIVRQAAPATHPVHLSTSIENESILAAIPAGTPSWTLSVTDRLPDVHGFTFDPLARRVSFQLEGTVGYDATIVELVWRLGESRFRTWRVMVPPRVTSFVIPKHAAMPETDAPDSGQPVFVRISLLERDDLPSYDAARGVPLGDLRNGGTARRGATGLVRWATFEPL